MGEIHAARNRLPVAVPLVAGLAMALALLALAINEPMWRAWTWLLPYGHPPVFGDLAITLDHLAEAARGLDPLGDPKSEFAYPRIVLAFHHTGIHEVASPWVGFIQSLVVVVAIVAVLRPSTIVGAVGVAALLFTPPILLGFERANLDLALFVLCAGGAWFWSRADRMSALVVPVSFLVLATLLKLHPVFALIGAAVAERGQRRLPWLLGLAGVAAYWAANRAEMELIAEKIPVSTWGSWGCQVFFVRLERFIAINREGYVWLSDLKWPVIAFASFAVSAVIAFALGLLLSRHFARTSISRRDWCHYWTGAAICIGSFAGANIAYRWIFVLFTIPLLVRLARAGDPRVAWWSRAALLAVAASLLSPLHAGLRDVFIVTQAAHWACVLLLTVGCGALARRPVVAIANAQSAEVESDAFAVPVNRERPPRIAAGT